MEATLNGTNRIDAESFVVKSKPRKSKPARMEKKSSVRLPDHLRTYAYAGVAVMAVLSACLNGHANAQHASVEWAGWGMGIAIPVIILLLGKVAGLLHKRGCNGLAYLTAGAGIGLLMLSVWHCASSIAMLTGSSLPLAIPMAVAIDVGFVACEIAALVD